MKVFVLISPAGYYRLVFADSAEHAEQRYASSVAEGARIVPIEAIRSLDGKIIEG